MHFLKDTYCSISTGDTKDFIPQTLKDRIDLVSVASDGTQANSSSGGPDISANGRYLAYVSSASNLVPGDTNGVQDIFVFDRQTGSTERVSMASDGTQANNDGMATSVSISGNGRYVSYTSYASNLVPGDINDAPDVFVFDRKTRTTELVSGASDGTAVGGAFPDISASGRYVTYSSNASDLVPGDTNSVQDIFVLDRKTGATERVSVASNGTEANSFSFGSSISADGRYITYASDASNLVPGDSNNASDVFAFDRKTGTTERVSVASNGTQGNDGSGDPSISADGRYVTYFSFATNLIPGDTNDTPGVASIFVFDRKTGTTERVSVTHDGTEANGGSFNPDISADGRFVTYASGASNLVLGDTNGSFDAFVFDRQTNTTTRVSVASDGTEATGQSFNPVISANGRFVSFDSWASDLVAGDTNGAPDVFVVQSHQPHDWLV
jgi:Tol biopolymer transport system component